MCEYCLYFWIYFDVLFFLLSYFFRALHFNLIPDPNWRMFFNCWEIVTVIIPINSFFHPEPLWRQIRFLLNCLCWHFFFFFLNSSFHLGHSPLWFILKVWGPASTFVWASVSSFPSLGYWHLSQPSSLLTTHDSISADGLIIIRQWGIYFYFPGNEVIY